MPELCLVKWPLLFVGSTNNRSNYVEYSNTFGKNGCIELRFYGEDSPALQVSLDAIVYVGVKMNHALEGPKE